MIKLVDDNKEYYIRNTLEEITFKEFNQITQFELKKYTFLKKWLETIKLLCSDKKVINIDDKLLFNEVIPKFDFDEKSEEYIDEIELEGDIYKANLNQNGEPKSSVKIITDIETYINNNPNDWIKYAVAMLFTNISNPKQTFNDKADVIYNHLTAYTAVPFITYINNRMNENFNKAMEIYDVNKDENKD